VSDNYLLGVDVLAGAAIDVFDEDDIEQIAERVVAEVEAADRALRPLATEEKRFLKSELPGVSDEEWTQFVLAMKTANLNEVSDSNAYGMFEMKPRRLVDLGLMKSVKPVNARSTGHMAWKGEWKSPLSEKGFLESAEVQYRAFSESMKRYAKALEKRPNDMTLSGALAVLHRCGPNGLVIWGDEDRRFPDTVALFDATNGLF